jgi:hypothetical protein
MKVSNFYNRQTRIKNQRTQKLRSIHDDTMRTSGVELEVAKNEIITTINRITTAIETPGKSLSNCYVLCP